MAEKEEIRDVKEILQELMNDSRVKTTLAFRQASEASNLDNVDGAFNFCQEGGKRLEDMGNLIRMQEEISSLSGRLTKLFQDLGITPPHQVTISLQEYKPEEYKPALISPHRNTPIEVLNLNSRAYKGLKRIQIKTIEELLKVPDAELLNIRNIGPGTLRHIKDRLGNFTRIHS